MNRFSRRTPAVGFVVFASLAVSLMAGAPASAAPPTGAQLANCQAPKYPGVGYFTSLSVSGTTCSTGSKVAIAYYHCRVRHGLAGRCVGGVLGFRCTEKRVSIPTEIDARVTCVKGNEKVIHTYQQDTDT